MPNRSRRASCLPGRSIVWPVALSTSGNYQLTTDGPAGDLKPQPGPGELGRQERQVERGDAEPGQARAVKDPHRTPRRTGSNPRITGPGDSGTRWRNCLTGPT